MLEQDASDTVFESALEPLLMAQHLEQALRYARRFSLSLVFALLAPPWVLRAVVGCFVELPEDAAVVLADRKASGALPAPGWGAAKVL